MWPPVSTNWMAECALERRRVGCFVLPVCGDGAPPPLAPSKELIKNKKEEKRKRIPPEKHRPPLLSVDCCQEHAEDGACSEKWWMFWHVHNIEGFDHPHVSVVKGM